jgi:sugar lactone lactonase YvrE
MKIASLIATFGLLSVVMVGVAWAAPIDRWSASTEREFLLGTFDGTAIDREGRIGLAPRLTHLWGPEAGIVWDIAAGSNGSVFVALSGPGQIVSIDADGSATAWYRADGESLVTALAADGKGGVYAGLSPEGRVLHIEGPGEVAVLVETDATFVWTLETGARDTLWIGTGVPGRIQRYSADTGLETLHETGDDPVRSLVVTGRGEVIAGTGGRGRVIRVSGDDSPFVLFDAKEAEIVALAQDDSGTVWALAAAGKKQPTARPNALARGPVTHVRVTAEPPPPTEENENDDSAKPAEGERPPSTFRANGGGTLYKIDSDGIDAVWTTKQGIPFDLSLASDGSVLVATGDKGQVWRVDADGGAARMLPIPSNQASAIVRNDQGQVFIAGTSDARIERLEAEPRSSGDYLSLPVEAGSQARWGRVAWDAELPDGASIEASVRVGNTTEPDDTWSEWITLSAAGQIDSDRLPASRLIQVKLSLAATGDADPRVSALRVSYESRNRAPKIGSLTIEPPGVVIVPGPTQSKARLGPLVADDPVTRNATSRVARGRPRIPIRRGWEAGARTFSWKASDPDDDRLTYRLDIRNEGDLFWYPLAAGLTASYYSWDARATPDGRYRVRLTVSDETDNATGKALTRTETSEQFAIDNSRPALTDWSVKRNGVTRQVAFTAVDPGGSVAAVEVAMDAGTWEPLFPEDGVADSDVERYRLTLPREGQDNLPASLRVRITDAAGNLGGALKQVDAP